MISNFIFSLINFCIVVSFLTGFLAIGILFSTEVNEEVVTKPLILGNSDLISFIFVLRKVLVAKLLISGIFIFNIFLSEHYIQSF